MFPLQRPARVASTLLIAGAAAVILPGCGDKIAADSGFLSDYSRLEASSYVDGALWWQSPDYNLGKYQKFMFDPVVVHFAPSDSGGSVDPAKMEELTTYFNSQLEEVFSQKYQVVSKPGPGVLRCEAAITDVELGNTVLNIIPQAKLTGVGLGGASCEAAGFDGQSGTMLWEMKETRKGSQFSLKGANPLDNAKQVIDYWVERFRRHADAAHKQ
jgi:hypothetical protein